MHSQVEVLCQLSIKIWVKDILRYHILEQDWDRPNGTSEHRPVKGVLTAVIYGYHFYFNYAEKADRKDKALQLKLQLSKYIKLIHYIEWHYR